MEHLNTFLVNGAAEVVITLSGLVVAWAANTFRRRTGIEIEQVHIDRINQAIENIVREASSDGNVNVDELVQLSRSYMAHTIPAAVAAVKPTNRAIEAIVSSKIRGLF